MSRDPLQGLRVEVWDSDTSTSGGPYWDPLGLPDASGGINNTDITDAAGEFNVWFNGSVFAREATWTGEVMPDVLIQVWKEEVLMHTTPVDPNVLGSPHVCPPYSSHKGKEYVIEIDYVTVAINTVAFVDVANINSTGRVASYAGITDRPFGGTTTIGGRIWGAKVDKWKLYYTVGVVASNDTRFSGLGPGSADPTDFVLLAQGTNKIWDGPIHKWVTGGLEGTHTAILVVWDQDGNEFHDTRVLFLHNTTITPAAQISSPAPGSMLSKAAGSTVNVHGTASDDYFWYYELLWAGPTQTELTNANINYPVAGNHTPVINGKLGEWSASSLPRGSLPPEVGGSR